MTERVTNVSGVNIIVDEDYQEFYSGDDIRIVKFDKGKYTLVAEASSHIKTSSGSQPTSLTLDHYPTSVMPDSSSDIYLLNDTYRTIINASNNSLNQFVADVSGYQFEVGQVVGVIVTSIAGDSSGYSWGSSYRVSAVDGSTHTFNYAIPTFFVNQPGQYQIKVKHAFSTYADFSIITDSAIEANNNFNIYLKNSYCQEYYLYNTFVVVNILFDQDIVNDQWYNPSDNLVNNTFYYHPEAINVDVSTLIILKGTYDSSNYLLNQKNIWQVTHTDSSTILFKVFNDNVPYIYNQVGTYNVECTSYDSFGNAITKKFEGLINVK
jgi:hypothetical protein